MLTLAKTQKFYGSVFKGRIFDTGTKIGFLAANVAFALSRADISGDFRKAIHELGLRAE